MAGSFKFFIDTNHRKPFQEVSDVTGTFSEGQLYPVSVNDKLSSYICDLPEHVIIIVYEHSNGTGRQLVMWGKQSDSDTHNNGFKDCASSWKWVRV